MARHENSDEVVYRTQDDSHVVINEKVQSLAGSVYQEFEKMIARYDHDVVKDLMPLVVSVLESLDMSYTENQEHEVELELLKEDNEQLVTQYEREKQFRKNTEQKLLEMEDAVEDERKGLCAKIESLESIVRMLELKAKNASDHVFRLEEKEAEMKKEYTKLHERYTELFKTHVDYMERTKMMLSSTDRIDPPVATSAASIRPNRLPSLNLMNRSSGPVSFGFQSLEEIKDPSLSEDIVTESPHGSTASNTSLLNEMQEVQEGEEKKNIHSPEPDEPTSNATTPMGRSTTKLEQRSGNTLYQELSFQDPELLAPDPDEGSEVVGGWVHPGEFASSANDNFFGMGKEVENLIMENNELLATKNALNIVKDDLILKVDELTSEQEVLREELHALQTVKDKLKQRVADLEEELKKVKEEATKQPKTNKSDDEEEDVPMAQRKRFTRTEMARVLMERNQYKERYMELQEAIRWMELKRAHLKDVADDKKGKSMWTLFSNLFRGSGEKELVGDGRRPVPMGVLYGAGAPTGPHVSPTLLPARAASEHGMPPSATAFGRKRPDNVDKLAYRLANERKEQYRQVRAHVRKDDGRLQAYGWSLPAKVPNLVPAETSSSKSHISHVPVPVYCQPLRTCEPGHKIWCAAGVNLSGGRTKDGGSIVGSSVFYTQPNDEFVNTKEEEEEKDSEPHIAKIEEELKESEKVRVEAETLEQRLSPLVWICSSTRVQSKVTVIDATDPVNVLDSFVVCSSYLLCIASVPGATESDYQEEETNNNATEITDATNAEQDINRALNEEEVEGEGENFGRVCFVRVLEKTENFGTDEGKLSTVLPTMWMGFQNGWIYVHSSVSNWSQNLVSVQLPDSILSITHCAGRVLASLANGSVILFKRNSKAEWDFNGYHRIELGGPQHSVRCTTMVHRNVWCGYQNKIHVLDSSTLAVKMSFEAHPRKESQVRLMAWLGDGVWVSIRLDSTLRLYHAHTYQHLQDVDIEPYVSKMLGTGKLGFSFVRITALLVSTNRLWIGTGNGVIISVPLSERNYGNVVSPTSLTPKAGGPVRIYCDSADKLTPGSFVPYCSMSQAQLSFHGHRDAVKFFIAVPSTKAPVSNPNMLVMSGGDGYVDFRIGDGSEDEDNGGNPEEIGESSDIDLRGRKLDLSHLIIWQVSLTTSS